MNVEAKVLAAISSAIGYYLQAEQETLAASIQTAAQPLQQPFATVSPFGMAGRQAAMDVRWTWQMRLVR